VEVRQWGAALLLLGASACASVRGELPVPVPRPATAAAGEAAPWLAGAAEIDITPPPGYPTAGHSFEGSVALGVWTRLRAQAIYVEDARGVPLVLVVGDLWGIEPGLVDRVASLLGEHPGLRHVGREHLVIAATHTHHGPGLYSTARTYSAFAAPEGGHDPELFEMLAGRLAAAIAEAAAARRPARIVRHAVAVPALARNRSVEPLLRDPEASELLKANAGLPGCAELDSELAPVPGVDPCHAVSPVLELLHVIESRPGTAASAAEGRTIAVAGFFAMHPTSMPNKTELYHADVFGIATARAQALLSKGGGEGVVGLWNGAQGDVSPNWELQGRTSTVGLGQALGDAIVAGLHEPGREVVGAIDVAFAWREIAGERFVDGDGNEQRTGRRAIPGKGQFGGAEDGRTRLYDRGWSEGVRRNRPRKNGQGHKRHALPWPVSMLAPPRGMTPRKVPLQVVRLGDVSLVTLPGEHTTVLGKRIERAVANATEGEQAVLLVGLAGAYLSYFTTPEEYELQHYEGASMLYGEQSGMLVMHHLAELARSGAVERDEEYRYRPGRIRRWTLGRSRLRALPDIEDRLAVQLETGPLLGLPRFYVWDRAPQWPTENPRTSATPRVRLETWNEGAGAWETYAHGGVPVDDRTGQLVSMLTHVNEDRWRWGVWWLEPGAGPDQQLRFRVDTVAEGPVCSEVFTMSQWFRPEGPGWLEPRECTLGLDE
jgi:neutral ceramidase